MAEIPQSQTFASVDQLPLIQEAGTAAQFDRAPSLRSRFFASRLGRAASTLAAGAGLVAAGVFIKAAPAQAESGHTYTVTGTGSEGVWLHGDPGLGDKGDLIKIMPEGTKFTADCYVNDTVIGDNPVWLHGTDGESTGWFTDAYSSSRWNKNNTLEQQGLPICGETAPTQAEEQSSPERSTDIPNPDFNRMAGVNWALNNARDPQENGIQCTWFVSNALWRAGLPKSEQWTDQKGYWSRAQHFDGTPTAHVAPKLVEYLRDNVPSTWQELGSINNYNVPDAEVGDVIAYSWEGNGQIDHVALVVGHSEKNPDYPLVAEHGQFNWDGLAAIKNNISNPRSPYTKRGWTWSEMHHRRLTEGYPNATAYLLHINGGYIVSEF